MHKAILIDPFACEIKEIKIDGDDLDAVYSALSHETVKVSAIEALRLDHGDAIFFDEEANIKNRPTERFVVYVSPGRKPWPLSGKCLILGSDVEGNSQSCKIDINTVRDHFKFGKMQRAGADQTGIALTTEPWSAA